MRVVIAGGHGKIALHLARRLAERGDTPVSLVRDPDHLSDIADIGAEAAVFDLENDGIDALTPLLTGADAVVFAAGAGPNSGIERKDTVDRAGAALLADAAERAGVRRYVLVGSMGVTAEALTDPGWTPPADVGEVFSAYLVAKAASERDLAGRDLDATVLRPGKLTDEPATGLVRLGTEAPHEEIPRDDVAAVLVALLDAPATAGHTYEVVSGSTPIPDAVAHVHR